MKKLNLITAVLGAAFIAVTAYSQTPSPIAPIIQVNRVVVKPDRVTEWLECEKQFTEAYKKGGGPWRRIYRSASGRIFEYMVTAPINGYSDLDGESFIAKGASEADRARWAARRAQCTESVQTTYERLVPDAAINTTGTNSPKMLIVNRYNVRAGMADQFVDFLKTETLPVMKKAGVSLWVARRTDYGGSRWSYVVRRGIDKYADLDTNLAEKILGKDGAAKYFAKSATLLNNVTIDLYVYMPDVSFVK